MVVPNHYGFGGENPRSQAASAWSGFRLCGLRLDIQYLDDLLSLADVDQSLSASGCLQGQAHYIQINVSRETSFGMGLDLTMLRVEPLRR